MCRNECTNPSYMHHMICYPCLVDEKIREIEKLKTKVKKYEDMVETIKMFHERPAFSMERVSLLEAYVSMRTLLCNLDHFIKED